LNRKYKIRKTRSGVNHKICECTIFILDILPCKAQGQRAKEQGARSKEQGARSKEQGKRLKVKGEI